jgi:hypothetical protein
MEGKKESIKGDPKDVGLNNRKDTAAVNQNGTSRFRKQELSFEYKWFKSPSEIQGHKRQENMKELVSSTVMISWF